MKERGEKVGAERMGEAMDKRGRGGKKHLDTVAAAVCWKLLNKLHHEPVDGGEYVFLRRPTTPRSRHLA